MDIEVKILVFFTLLNLFVIILLYINNYKLYINNQKINDLTNRMWVDNDTNGIYFKNIKVEKLAKFKGDIEYKKKILKHEDYFDFTS